MQNRLWMGIALLHLFFVTLGSAGIDLMLPGEPGRAFDFYKRVSGSSFGYAFFTPGIYNQLIARFEVIDGEGRARSVPLVTGVNKEADLRVISVLDQFNFPLQDGRRPEEVAALRRSLSASLARNFFRRYPDTQQVVVHLDDYEPVSREDFLRGEKPKVTTMYRAQYALNPRAPR